jgi:hypothetical protein
MSVSKLVATLIHEEWVSMQRKKASEARMQTLRERESVMESLELYGTEGTDQ